MTRAVHGHASAHAEYDADDEARAHDEYYVYAEYGEHAGAGGYGKHDAHDDYDER